MKHSITALDAKNTCTCNHREPTESGSQLIRIQTQSTGKLQDSKITQTHTITLKEKERK